MSKEAIQQNILYTHKYPCKYTLDGQMKGGAPIYDEERKILIGDNDYYTDIRQNSIKLFNYHAQHNTFHVELLDFLNQIEKDGIIINKTNILNLIFTNR